MNIAAVMATLDISGLDITAKHAVLVIACRANRHTGETRVSLRRLAKDMGCHRVTARRALDRAVEAGYLNVDKSPGGASVWHLDVERFVPPPGAICATTARRSVATKDKEGSKKEHRVAAPNGAAVQNLDPVAWAAGMAAARQVLAVTPRSQNGRRP